MRRTLVTLVVLAGLGSSWPSHVRAQERLLANAALPAVPVPPDNPQTDEKVQLGRMLYFDGRLSSDGIVSCATCHAPTTGWANRNRTDTGVRGLVGDRNSGTIIGAAYMRFQFWDGRVGTLEEQALGPIANPIEMGETLENVVRRLDGIPGYRSAFERVFGTGVTADGIGKAIAAFERTIIPGPSPYDLFVAGDRHALTAAARRGMALFNGKGHCTACHNGPMFSDQGFHNLGVGMDAANPDIGREKVTHRPSDRGRFKTPGLRNVAETAPYLHDGSEPTLAAVIDLYDRGGVANSNLDPLMLPLNLTDAEKADLVAFLEALSGPVAPVEAPVLPPNAAPVEAPAEAPTTPADATSSPGGAQ